MDGEWEVDIEGNGIGVSRGEKSEAIKKSNTIKPEVTSEHGSQILPLSPPLIHIPAATYRISHHQLATCKNTHFISAANFISHKITFVKTKKRFNMEPN